MNLVRRIISPDGKREVCVYKRIDGFFAYEEIFETFDEIAGSYWSSGYQSGVFETEGAAMAEIAATTPWLRTGS
ncbi:hypothetical protein V6U71_02135 [Sphingopyxis sp. J-6]|uniref:hypothetical protein n=1 Tax=Sphingopyxis sp. J-6 TaxID=3122054 RepID=UPI0039843E91